MTSNVVDRIRDHWIRASLLLAFGFVLAPQPARALPRYAAAYGQECGLCHVDPTGGGIRTTYASQFLVPTELAWRNHGPQALEAIDPTLGEHLVVGADLRLLVHEAEGPSSTLFTMQTDLHLALAMDARTSILFDLGAGRRAEAFGLVRGGPWEGWIKAGRFVPAYGWRFADHQLFARRHLLSTEGEDSPVGWEDSGAEFGIAPGRWQFTASIQGGGGAIGESYAARLVTRKSVHALDLSLGTSMLRRQSASGHRRAVGGFTAIGSGPWTWTAQVDLVRSEERRSGWILTQEAAWRLARGWSLLLTHEFHDPDRDRRDGARERVGLGIDTLLTPFVGITAIARAEHTDGMGTTVATERFRADVVVHFLF